MRCDGCDRRWPASARFCGRCGGRLAGARLRGGASSPASGDADRVGWDVPALARDWAGRLGAVLLIALTGVVVAGIVVEAPPAGTGSGGAVSIPSAAPSPGTAAVRAADRSLRPADCSDHLQELPRPIRKNGLFSGTLEWRDGRLCRPLPPTRPEPPPRCQPPGLPPCTVP